MPWSAIFVLKYICSSILACLHLQEDKQKEKYMNEHLKQGWFDIPMLTKLNRGVNAPLPLHSV